MVEKIIIILLSFLFGGTVAWFVLKNRKNKNSQNALNDVAVSKENDKNRDDIKSKIEEQIQKNIEIIEKLKEKIK